MSVIHWNHNYHYHDLLLSALPQHGRSALDVGCGTGELAIRLAPRYDRVVGVDRDSGMVAVARTRVPDGVTVVEGDALAVEPPDGGFDAITCVASLHHLGHQVGVETALKQLRGMLAPGGTLVVLGLTVRPAEPLDYLAYPVANLANLAVGIAKRLRHGADRQHEHGEAMPMLDADVTLPELRRVAEDLLPGVSIRRLLFWRYLLVYTGPR
jgi:ubiquinone/menaquinone biosynthesis C-methylase UbiE